MLGTMSRGLGPGRGVATLFQGSEAGNRPAGLRLQVSGCRSQAAGMRLIPVVAEDLHPFGGRNSEIGPSRQRLERPFWLSGEKTSITT